MFQFLISGSGRHDIYQKVGDLPAGRNISHGLFMQDPLRIEMKKNKDVREI